MPAWLAEFLKTNFFPLFALWGLVLLLRFNVMLEKKLTRFFRSEILTLLLAVACDALLLYEESLPDARMLHFIASAVSYILYPTAAAILVYVFLPLSKNKRRLIWIPAALNAACAIASVFTPIIFDYTADNVFGRGTFGYLPHVVGIGYLIAFLFAALIQFHVRRRMNTLLMLAIVACCLGGLLVESLTGFYALNMACVLSLLLYYGYLLSYTYRQDPLTGALNRKIFYLDTESKKHSITAVVSVDMDGLKLLNDGKGHAAGDEALVTLAECCMRNIGFDPYRFYRMGGDEFTLLAFGPDVRETEKLVERIRQDMERTPYRASFGVASFQANDTLDNAMLRADAAMYAAKAMRKNASAETPAQTTNGN